MSPRKVLNPLTGRYVKVGGSAHAKMLARKSPKRRVSPNRRVSPKMSPKRKAYTAKDYKNMLKMWM